MLILIKYYKSYIFLFIHHNDKNYFRASVIQMKNLKLPRNVKHIHGNWKWFELFNIFLIERVIIIFFPRSDA